MNYEPLITIQLIFLSSAYIKRKQLTGYSMLMTVTQGQKKTFVWFRNCSDVNVMSQNTFPFFKRVLMKEYNVKGYKFI